MTTFATVKLNMSTTTTTATVHPDDGSAPEPYGAGITRTTAPARLAEFGWHILPRSTAGWALLPPDGYQCRAFRIDPTHDDEKAGAPCPTPHP